MGCGPSNGYPLLQRTGASPAHNERCGGFTLIEILVAMTILSIGLLGIAALTGTAYKSASYARALTQATNVAQNRVEALLGIPYANLEASLAERPDLARACAGPAGGAARPVYDCIPTSQLTIGVAPDTKTYTWSYTVTLIDLNADGTANATDGLKRIDVTVNWADPLSNSTNTVVVTTMRARE
ncbi:MAG: prepilin-type N-terminal cleavage/methylation domain-containing protein [Deltaproteobacteria bacterium]|nr:prepilin-type N-terminal cleavage/methylation domain-containing protein [Deltaproteobacteria bacterium]